MSKRFGSESGAVAVVTAFVLTVLLLVSAIVLDLGALRVDMTSGKSVGDMAAAAAAVDYEAGEEGAALQACKDALTYAVKNLALDPPPSDADIHDTCVAEFPETYVCPPPAGPIVEKSVEYAHAPYTIEITLPVDDDNDLMQEQANSPGYDATIDGDPCERIGVRIGRDRDFLLAGALGMADGSRTEPGSVGRAGFGEDFEEFPSLVVLRRTGCQTLWTQGGTEGIEVEPIAEQAGIITVDTLPPPLGCNNGIIRAGGTSGITAPGGDIYSHALKFHTKGEVITRGNNATIDPEPGPGELVTRRYLDHRYNCKESYSARDSSRPYDPVTDQIPLDDCPTFGTGNPESPSSSYIKALHDEVEAVTTAATDGDPLTDPPGWTIRDSCTGTYDGDDPGNDVRLFLDCTVDGALEIKNVEHVVVNGGINLGGDVFKILDTPADGTLVVIRDGDIRFTGGGSGLRFRNVFTYHMSGRWNLSGNPDRLAMQAPEDTEANPRYTDTQCHGEDLPAAKCFAPVAYWGNSANPQRIRGGAAGGIIGSMFTPNSTVDINPDEESPGSCGDDVTWDDLVDEDDGSLNLRAAQIWAEAYNMGGGAKLHLCPSPGTTIPILVEARGLIR